MHFAVKQSERKKLKSLAIQCLTTTLDQVQRSHWSEKKSFCTPQKNTSTSIPAVRFLLRQCVHVEREL